MLANKISQGGPIPVKLPPFSSLQRAEAGSGLFDYIVPGTRKEDIPMTQYAITSIAVMGPEGEELQGPVDGVPHETDELDETPEQRAMRQLDALVYNMLQAVDGRG